MGTDCNRRTTGNLHPRQLDGAFPHFNPKAGRVLATVCCRSPRAALSRAVSNRERHRNSLILDTCAADHAGDGTSMPSLTPGLFFFDLRQGDRLIRDDEGVACQNLREAQTMAVAAARSMFAADAMSGLVDLDQEIRVLHCGEVVASVNFRDAVTLRS